MGRRGLVAGAGGGRTTGAVGRKDLVEELIEELKERLRTVPGENPSPLAVSVKSAATPPAP
jgi:hypothetical protein